METIDGQIVRYRWRTQDKSFSIGTLKTTAGDEHVFKGSVMAEPGDTVKLHGRFIDDPKWGRQFQVKNQEYGDFKDRAGIIGFLDRLPNIGPVRAATIYRTFKEKTFDVIEHEPQRLTEAPGITPRMVENIHRAYMEEKLQRDVIVFLKKFSLTDYKIAKIIDTYKSKTKSIIKTDPYRMIEEIDGFGFKTVDDIALSAGIDRIDPKRVSSGIIHVLNESQNNGGHTYLPKEHLFRDVCKLLTVPTENIKSMIEELITDGQLVYHEGGIYLPEIFEKETAAAKHLMSILSTQETPFNAA